MLVRCGLVIIRSKEIILEIIKQVELSGVLYGLTNKTLYHGGSSTTPRGSIGQNYSAVS